ncbi:ParB/RepB/Spo0J family partition protein [Leucobacter sp. UT-8R-CII-1-4]|uniref:ParB/RepB/Spo0J family partition protein n=1 Tax=Leucobacter sp. UT-8R-CII-1-4 TaxID=3040075 RepID=UPI0024A824CD|nr:ParB/RepB/Spo0J family partition protein [Leucobacter sp. UT-8R-CII-1-4]MDI6023473.1 ParB/RepB/Spo0J family partition protein [Leucobacter sp. UT-8R-CII-1-4]
MATKKRGGLGRGIGALIPQATEGERPVDVFFPSGGTTKAETSTETSADAVESAPTSEVELREVPGAKLTRLKLSEIVPNRVQPRTEFDEEALEELTHSIREFGVFQPVVVREIEPTPAEGEPRYELIMGERRFRASGRAGLEDIPAIVRSTADEHMLRDALLENLHRAQLNPLEEASAYQQLLADFGITQEQLASRIGRSRPQISNTIRLLKLPEPVQARVAAGVLSAGHARAILSVDTAGSGNADAMQRLADKIVNEGLSVRAAEAAAAETPKSRSGKKPRAGGVQAQLDAISERLGDRFDTRVHIKLGAKKGQVTIDFATIADLKRILDELGDPGFN